MNDVAMEAVIAKVRKLLALADNNPNENEAANAAAKAQELLEAYNLDMAVVGQKERKYAKREDKKRGGGLYKWQRNLWFATAQLNFCNYYFYRGLKAGSQYEHQLIGSQANVVSTEVMAQYLEGVVERLARKWVAENRPGKSIFIREAIAFREGVAGRLTGRLWEKRWARLAEDNERIKQERERNRAHGVNTENALVLQDVINTEEDLNADYINGWEPGTSARRRLEADARRAAAQAAAEELLRKQEEWDAAHPEEAARRKARQAQEDEARAQDAAKEWAKQQFRARKPTPEEERAKLRSYREGWNEGGAVSLDKQVDKSKQQALR